jgi:hypothetical protein
MINLYFYFVMLLEVISLEVVYLDFSYNPAMYVFRSSWYIYIIHLYLCLYIESIAIHRTERYTLNLYYPLP